MADSRWRIQDGGQTFQILNFIASYCFFSLYKCFLATSLQERITKKMALPILLIFYVSQWENNKKHCKIGIIGRGKSTLGVGLLFTEMIIVCKFHDPSITVSRDTDGEPPPPPQSQIDQKSPV